MQPDMSSLLVAEGPFVELEDKLMLYGQLVGSWDVEATWYDAEGGSRGGRGEWHFAWILGGRGIQDVLFASGASPHEFGTSLRCYDESLDAWHITWMQPQGGEYVHLIGRREDDRIVQEATNSDPGRRERWSFTDVSSDSFVWVDEVSLDGGATWRLEQEMRGVRRPTPSSAPP